LILVVSWVAFIVLHVLSLAPNIPQPILYFPVVALIYVNLKKELVSEDEDKRSMANQMISKFEKYWLEFSVMLAIVVVLDSRYKLRLVKYYYMKIYGDESMEYANVKDPNFLWSIVLLRLQAPQLFGPKKT
jgi:hypothetical protein